LVTKLEYAFALYDDDKNGYLDRNEIREVIKGMINLFGSNVNTAQTSELTEECINISRKKMNGILNGFKRVCYLNAFIRV
jgi:Ca2+-binding EF-hand superfamily protein